MPLRTTFDPVFEGDNAMIYVVDSGVDTDHPEFANANISKVHNPSQGSFDTFIGAGGAPYLVLTMIIHGTAMASLIAREEVRVTTC